MKHWVKMLLSGIVVCTAVSLCGFVGCCDAVRNNVVRVHILANSDSAADQALKLQVRDAVTAAGAGLLDGVTDRDEAERRLQASLPLLTQAAQQCIEREGYTYAVTAELTEAYFGTRTYDSGTFPAGRYHTVRISIGEAAGRNWWCVMYPPLCVSAATDTDALSDVLPNGACDVVENAPRYVVRFKIVEWLEALMERLR